MKDAAQDTKEAINKTTQDAKAASKKAAEDTKEAYNNTLEKMKAK